ncbi:hypothetical protein BDK51DRAFT_29484 [Blyttiomyces helicus]|uniref:Uncharacterized protein n=1 Tax=Blyttiomyces helicus TaxID=388810 RepID=A0A4P9WNJ9_9FUNG|nr:hypothetical protein BDK51DRAFT_29484 [Blyttiomyces helicus]|eukprot:RKO94544.1 hypothetical protein BDK51DRAFT_29484 [Blyttiomyces helicus]
MLRSDNATHLPPRPWALRNVNECGPNYDPKFRTVISPDLEPSGARSLRPRPFTAPLLGRSALLYPSTLRGLHRVEDLERRVETEMISEYEGLSEPQRKILVQALRTHVRTTRSAPPVISMLRKSPRDAQDWAEADETADSDDGGSSEPAESLVDSTESLAVELPPLAAKSDAARMSYAIEDTAARRGSIAPERTSSSEPSKLHHQQCPNDPKKIYAKLIERRRHRFTDDSKEESEASLEMRRVVRELNARVSIGPPAPRLNYPNPDAQIPSTPTLILPTAKGSPGSPLPTTPLSSSPPPPPADSNTDDDEAEEARDGGFSVLLSPWDPHSLEEKNSHPRVVVEANPPADLISGLDAVPELKFGGKSWAKELGRRTELDQKAHQNRKKTDNSVDFSGLESSTRLWQYGAWYLPPKAWGKVLEMTVAGKPKFPTRAAICPRGPSRIQQRIIEIETQRARDDAATIAACEAEWGAAARARKMLQRGTSASGGEQGLLLGYRGSLAGSLVETKRRASVPSSLMGQ